MVSRRSDGFAARESGAAAFDWVILAVGVFGLGLAIYSVITADMDGRQPTEQAVVERSVPTGSPPVSPPEQLPLLYPYFDAIWRAEQAATYAGLSDGDLLAAYAAQYAVATGEVNARIGMDFLAVIEEEMTRRGLARPEATESAADIHARLATDHSVP